jgi:hypothetical protein
MAAARSEFVPRVDEAVTASPSVSVKVKMPAGAMRASSISSEF